MAGYFFATAALFAFLTQHCRRHVDLEHRDYSSRWHPSSPVSPELPPRHGRGFL